MVKKRSDKSDQFEQKHRYYYNEHDDNQVEQIYHRQRKRKLKKRIRILLKVGIVALIVAFFVSPLSRVGSVTVSGEQLLAADDIIEYAGVSPDHIHALTYPYFIEKRLLEAPMIKEVNVQRGFFSGIHIKVKESSVLAYQYDGTKLEVVDEKGNLVEIDSSHLKDVQQKPRLLSFTDQDILYTFCSELAKVPEATVTLMSDIIFDPEEPYDKTRVRIEMSDGKTVYIRIEDMAGELKYYQEILSREPNACVYDIYGSKVYASPCP